MIRIPGTMCLTLMIPLGIAHAQTESLKPPTTLPTAPQPAQEIQADATKPETPVNTNGDTDVSPTSSPKLSASHSPVEMAARGLIAKPGTGQAAVAPHGSNGALFLLDGYAASMSVPMRIDLALVESRIRYLEAKAQYEALNKFKDEFQRVEQESARFAVRKADLVLEERKIALRKTQRLLNQARDRTERRAIEERLELERLSVRDAEITKDEAEFALQEAGREFDIRSREARLNMESADNWRQLILKEYQAEQRRGSSSQQQTPMTTEVRSVR